MTGYTCVGGTPPVSRATVERALRDLSVQALPPLRPTFQPPGGALTGLPVNFSTGQQNLRHARLDVLGVSIELDATPRWEWQWGDGRSLATADPGGRYPTMTVTHTYLRNGLQIVRVTSRWRARFTVEGLGPYPVPGVDLSQATGLRVDVRPARSVLTA
jgi:hypothetical protein